LSEDPSIEIWSEASESEGQLLEDIEKDGPMVTSVCFPQLGVPVSMSPSNDDPLACRTAKFGEDFRRTSRVCQIGDDFGKGFGKFEGQSSIGKDIQGAETQPEIDGSEGQLLEDIEKVGPMVTSVCFPRVGVPVSMSPSDNDPLVYQNAVFLLEREKALRPSRYTGDAFPSCQQESFEFERASGLSHVAEGGGAEFKPFYSEQQVLKLPTESRKEELRTRMSEIKQRSRQDPRLNSLLFRLQGFPAGSRRSRVIQEFWKSFERPRSGDLVHEFLAQVDDLERSLMSFSLNDFLETQDELYTLEHPMRPAFSTRAWGLWSRRSSAVTDGPGSLSSSMVGTGLVSGTGSTGTCVASRNPLQTSAALFLRGGL
jgi:hypothetical protein